MSDVNTERWRIFCAIELPPDVRARAAAHIAQLREAVPTTRASWERTEKLHLTLKFFGEVEPARILNQLTLAIERAAQSIAAFDLAIEGTGAFPPRGLPKVLWLGITDSSGALAHLQQRLETECAHENFPRESRRFHPHLTIARLRTPAGARELAATHAKTQFDAATFNVSEVVLIRSEMEVSGSRYTIISQHEFGKIKL